MRSWSHLAGLGMVHELPDEMALAMFNAMIVEFRRLYPKLSEKVVKELWKRCEFVRFKKDAVIVNHGEVCTHVLFAATGLVRLILKRERKEQTCWFMAEGDVVISVKSFYTQEPSEGRLVVMEDMDCIALHNDDLQFIYDKYIEFNVVGRLMTEKYHVLWDERITLLSDSAVGRCKMLFKESPKFINRVSDAMLASYLGVNKSTLSRSKGLIFRNKLMSVISIFKLFG
ncbi:Crp/Fnr family transcriptional regulator [Chitinophaga deserti]|uniref:Crp/Fnr family transcriptional regulator n=1 Tax=Chitinophaga deserti TaxID=2164099 RepID=UPI000D6B3BF0|nr:cyclic nucleotide-binding domain-containing protein [Chitinophaga deserti]